MVDLARRHISARAPATASERALLKRSRIRVSSAPRGRFAVVLECEVARQGDATYGENDDDVRFVFVVDEPGGPETVTMIWHENLAPQLDALKAGDLLWVEFGAELVRVTTWPDAWRVVLGAVNVCGKSAISARPQWNFPLCVERAETGLSALERVTVANQEVLLRELTCFVTLGDFMTALEATTRALPLDVWCALSLELLEACATGGFRDVKALRAGVKWTLTGAAVVEEGAAPAATRVAVASEALINLMAGTSLVSARLQTGAVPSTLSPERAAAFRELLAKLGRLELGSLVAIDAAVRAFVVPAPREVAMGVVFSLVPRNVEWLKALRAHPKVLPKTWNGVYAAPVDAASALAVLSDTWLERRVGVETLPTAVRATVVKV